MYEDEIEIELQTNTYFVRNASYFLGTRNGYLDLGNIANSIVEDDTKCPECGSVLNWDKDGYNPVCPNCGWTDE
jgi:ribosomal protein S27AE